MRSSYPKEKNLIMNYIEKNLRTSLHKDQINRKIVAEGDLQSCTYFHLRKFIDKKITSNWHVLNKLTMGKKTEGKKYPDISIIYLDTKLKVTPVILIELKEDFKKLRLKKIKQDILKLTKLIKKNKNNLEMTYIISSFLDDEIHPKYMDKKIEAMIPKKYDGWIKSVSVNVLGKRNYHKYTKNLQKEIGKLRKYRND